MAAGLAFDLAFSNYVLVVCKALQSCKESHELQHILQGLLDLATFTRQGQGDLQAPAKEAGSLSESVKRVYHELHLHGDADVHIALAFCQHLEVIACSLLPAMTCNAFSSGKANLMLADKLFLLSPAAAVLQALTGYITSVKPVNDPPAPTLNDLLRPRTQAVGTDLAAHWLATRFATPDSTGLIQLCQELHSIQQSCFKAVFLDSRSAEALASDCASSLVSLVDRGLHTLQPEFGAEQLIPQVVRQLWTIASDLCCSRPANSASSDIAPAPSGPSPPASSCSEQRRSAPQLAFAGQVLGRFCRRGFVSQIAQALWQQAVQRELSPHKDDTSDIWHAQKPESCHTHNDTLQGALQHSEEQLLLPQRQQQQQQQSRLLVLVHSVMDSSALEKLLVALLQEACQLEVTEVTDRLQDSGMALMQRLVSSLWERNNIRQLFASKLLMQPQLPLPVLTSLTRLLKDLGNLPDLRIDSSETSSSAAAPSLPLLTATSNLAQVWADKAGSNRGSIKQQSYMAAAMAMCIAQVTKAQLERTRGLLPLVLQGVSLRLANPVEAIRRQGMRVGNAFSRALDPAKPLLFASFPLDLLQEEQWHSSAARLDPQDPLQLKPDPHPHPKPDPHPNPQPKPIPTSHGNSSSALAVHQSSVSSRLTSAACPGTIKQGSVPSKAAGQRRDASHASSGHRDGPTDSRQHSCGRQVVPTDSRQHSCGRQVVPADSRQHSCGRQVVPTDSRQHSCGEPPLQQDGAEPRCGDVKSSTHSSPEQKKRITPEQSWGSDHETDSDDDSLEAYDLSEGDDDGLDSGDWPMQLRDIAASLRKSEDVNDKLRALRLLQGALAAAPDELQHYAGELSRALLHLRTPDWADEEAEQIQDKPQTQRYRSLVALLVQAPPTAGNNLTLELYSPHLDMHQRMLILETMATAAQQLATAGLRLRDAQTQRSLSSGQPGPAPAKEGRTRRWGVKSLQIQHQQQQQQQQGQGQGHRAATNVFTAVALPWTAGLLRECDQARHGVDLFGRDPLLLGRLLITLGTFVECCGAAPVTPQLAACVLELVRSQGVQRHPQPYVRRSALLASAQVLATLPPARLAGAMATSSSLTSSDAILVDQLQWLQSWVQDVAVQDVDVQCQQLAVACQNLQGSLAAKALEALENGPPQSSSSLQGLPSMQSTAALVGAFQSGVTLH